MTPVMELAEVRRRLGERAILAGANLQVAVGEIVALLGASGAGKSTLLRAVAGLEPIDAGAIRLSGEVASRAGYTQAPEDRRIGLVFQDFALFPHMTLLENIAFGLAGMERGERQAEATRWLAQVGLAGRGLERPHALSGGEQQRLALARALAPRPRALLLDEPFSGLDASLRAGLRTEMLAALRAQGIAALLVTHDADEALEAADRVAVMEAGRIVQAGPPAAVRAHPATLAAAQALGAVNLWRGEAANGAVVMPFGPLATPLTGAVVIAAHAEALRLDPEGVEARVVLRRPQTIADLVLIEAGGVRWRAAFPAGVGPREGELLRVSLDPAHAFAFTAP